MNRENRLVTLVCLICLVYLVEPDYNRIDQRNQMNQTNHKPRAAFLNSLRVLLVPAYAQVCFVKTERRIMGVEIGTSTIVCYTEFRRFRNV